MCRAMRDKDRTAKQTGVLLVKLFKVTCTREMNCALESSGNTDKVTSVFISPGNAQPEQHDQNILVA